MKSLPGWIEEICTEHLPIGLSLRVCLSPLVCAEMSVASAQMMASFVKLLLDQAQQQAKLRENAKKTKPSRGRQLRRPCDRAHHSGRRYNRACTYRHARTLGIEPRKPVGPPRMRGLGQSWCRTSRTAAVMVGITLAWLPDSQAGARSLGR
jgi:hypothetical protein